MLSRCLCASVIGLRATLIEVETDISPGLFSFQIVGLPEKSIQEARQRVLAAITNSGFSFPKKRITVNLAPANVSKSGTHYDLAIAIGILKSAGQIKIDTEKILYIGELSLDGHLRKVTGMIPFAELAQNNFSIVFPESNSNDIQLLPNKDQHALKNLKELVTPYKNNLPLPIPQFHKTVPSYSTSPNDMAYIHGQKHAKRMLEIAAAGGHNVLLTGSPGSGKSMLAQAFPSVLPPLSDEELLEVTKIRSISEKEQVTFSHERPFRNPHHSISHTALVGGGTIPQPGEITLAHRGVLFLDELPEFSSQSLEGLRQPLEQKSVTISRTKYSVTFPANIILIGAMNPCKCGWLYDDVHECTCNAFTIAQYKKKISGPILDRIDLQMKVPSVSFSDLQKGTTEEFSREIQNRVIRARAFQQDRFSKVGPLTNADMNNFQTDQCAKMNSNALKLIESAMKSISFTARAYYRIIKVSRTIADLAESETISKMHIEEALAYRLGI